MTDKQSKPWRVMFWIILIVPTLVWFILLPFLPKEEESAEKREMAEFPELTPDNYVNISDGITSFYEDRLPFRTALISLNSYGIYQVFHEAGMPNVVVGKKNWLFYNRPEDGDNVMDYKGLAVFSQEHKELAMSNIAISSENLKKRGCDLAMIVVPDKDHIYPEFMPSYIYGPGPSRADDFVFYVRTMLDLPIVYPKAEFMMYKEENPDQELYFHYDTHWNDLGAYLGARALLSELGIESTAVWELETEEYDNSPYDLAKLLSIQWFVHDDKGYRIRDPYGGKVTVLNGSEDEREIMHFTAEGENVDPRRLVVIRDSFGIELNPFLAEHFAETYVVHRRNIFEMGGTKKLFDELKPDLVIYEISERYLSQELLMMYLE